MKEAFAMTDEQKQLPSTLIATYGETGCPRHDHQDRAMPEVHEPVHRFLQATRWSAGAVALLRMGWRW